MFPDAARVTASDHLLSVVCHGIISCPKLDVLCVYEVQHSLINFQNPAEGRVTVTPECLLLSVGTGPARRTRQDASALLPGEEKNPILTVKGSARCPKETHILSPKEGDCA